MLGLFFLKIADNINKIETIHVTYIVGRSRNFYTSAVRTA